jgi:hypothetical protein
MTLMHRTPGDHPRAPKGMKAAVRGLLLVPLTPEGARIIDIVILPIGAIVAFVVCIPIWVLSILAAAVVGSALVALGAPEEVRDTLGAVGIVGGLVLSFVALVRIYRRVPAGIRSWVTPDEERRPRASAIENDLHAARNAPNEPEELDAITATLEERLTAADAALAAGGRDPEG